MSSVHSTNLAESVESNFMHPTKHFTVPTYAYVDIATPSIARAPGRIVWLHDGHQEYPCHRRQSCPHAPLPKSGGDREVFLQLRYTTPGSNLVRDKSSCRTYPREKPDTKSCLPITYKYPLTSWSMILLGKFDSPCHL
jgi:hypothetical protein